MKAFLGRNGSMKSRNSYLIRTASGGFAVSSCKVWRADTGVRSLSIIKAGASISTGVVVTGYE